MNSSEFFMYNLIQVCENYSGSYLIKCTYCFQTTREVGLFIKFLVKKYCLTLLTSLLNTHNRKLQN